MHRRRPAPRLLLVVALGLVGASLVVSPALAGGKSTEVGTRVKVQGAKLPESDDVGSPDDPAIGKTVPTLKGRSLDGEKVTFGNDGTPRVMIFLSHSCPHCQAEVPVIVDLAKAGKLDGVEMQTVTTNTSEDLPNYPPSKWLEREDWPYEPVLADDAKLRAFFALGGQSFPYFVLVDADGKVVARASGELPAKTIEEAVRRLAAGEPIFTS